MTGVERVCGSLGAHQDVPEVRITMGITISVASAKDLVGVIDKLAVNCAPAVLSPRTVALRNELIRCCRTYANTSADVSTEVVAGHELISFQPDTAVDSKTAAKQLGMTGAGVRWLCRKERLTAKVISGRWWIDQESLDCYIEERRH